MTLGAQEPIFAWSFNSLIDAAHIRIAEGRNAGIIVHTFL